MSDTPSSPPTFSLVIGTKGRSSELMRLLDSLAEQARTDIEVIIVDQNGDDRLVEIVRGHAVRLRITHARVAFTGLSRARNHGLTLAKGVLVAFPDDDCWFPPGVLNTAWRLLAVSPELHGICGRSAAPNSASSHLNSGTRRRMLNAFSVWQLAISYTIFLRREVVEAVGPFDETLGVGAGTAWGSGEETDYLLRALALGFKLRYEPSLVIWHPPMPTVYTEQSFARGLSYGAGLGRVLRKAGAPRWFAALMLLRALAGACLGIAMMRPDMFRFHTCVLRGRWRGWRAALP